MTIETIREEVKPVVVPVKEVVIRLSVEEFNTLARAFGKTTYTKERNSIWEQLDTVAQSLQ